MNEVMQPGSNWVGWLSRRLDVLTILVFIAFIIFIAVWFQILSGMSPSNESGPLEFFTQGLLWMLSLTCLLIANRHRSWKLAFWLAGCVALMLLAIDERFEFHEQTGRRGWFDDDWFKIISWVCAAVVLYTIVRIERPARFAVGAIIVGYVFHTTYIFFEMGDGEFFRLPYQRITLWWWEEISELLFLSSYLVGFVLIHLPKRYELSARGPMLILLANWTPTGAPLQLGPTRRASEHVVDEPLAALSVVSLTRW